MHHAKPNSTSNSSSYSFPTPTSSCLAPTGNSSTLTGSPSATSTIGTRSYNTASGAWSAWSSDPVTYDGSSTPSAHLTTGWVQSYLLGPPMYRDGKARG